MSAAPGGLFFDTNVIAYVHDRASPAKQWQALACLEVAMAANRLVISTQVLQELYNVMLRKRWLTASQALELLQRLAEHTVVPASAESVLRAVALQQKHRLSIWDALIVQAALDARCAVLYSEDLQEGRRFESATAGAAALQVLNPFNVENMAPAVHEALATYNNAPAKQRRRGRAPR